MLCHIVFSLVHVVKQLMQNVPLLKETILLPHRGKTSSHHACSHVPGLCEANVAHQCQCDTNNRRPPDFNLTSSTGEAAHGGTHHPDRRYFLCGLPPAPARLLLCLLLPLLHPFITQRLTHSQRMQRRSRGRHL